MKTHTTVKQPTFKNLVHVVMLFFAGASLGNIQTFLEAAGHPKGVAWALGVALGAALVAVSIMLTHVDRQTDSEAFNWLLAAGVVLGLISGSLQAAEYSKHLAYAWAIVLGFGVPLGGEVLLAFAVSAYTRSRQRERFRNVSVLVEDAVADRLESAVAELNPEAIKKHVERTINGLARLAVDSVTAQAAQFYVKMDAQPDISDAVQSPKVDASKDDLNGEIVLKTAELNVIFDDGRNKANEQKRTKKHERQDEVLRILLQQFNGKMADELNKTSIAEQLDTTRQTIGRDIEDLIEAGRLVVNGKVEVLS